MYNMSFEFFYKIIFYKMDIPMTQINAGSPLRGLSAVFVDKFIDIAGGIASVIACFNSGELVIDSFLLSTST